MRNRGYKYIIKKSSEGYLLMCVNAVWINQLLKDRGLRPKDFRQLSWKDIARVQESSLGRRLFSELKPIDFWQMVDTVSLKYASYVLEPGKNLSEQEWFIKYPLFAIEDVYELLLECGLSQEDALRIMEVTSRGQCGAKLKWQEFVELYDVPEGLMEALSRCSYLPPREKMVNALLDDIALAIIEKTKTE